MLLNEITRYNNGFFQVFNHVEHLITADSVIMSAVWTESGQNVKKLSMSFVSSECLTTVACHLTTHDKAQNKHDFVLVIFSHYRLVKVHFLS